MSDAINSVYDFQEIDILARVILGKKAIPCLMTLWSEKESDTPEKGLKKPFRIYVVNDGSKICASPLTGSPVRSIKLCKRAIAPGYPKNMLIPPHKSKISYRFALSLLVEYENGGFNVLTLPNQLSALPNHASPEVSAFHDYCVGQNPSTDMMMHHKSDIDEKLTIISGITSTQTFFEYCTNLEIGDLQVLSHNTEPEEQSLQSYVQTKNLKFEAEILEQLLVHIGQDLSVWATVADISLSEDFILKIVTDQDIVVHGIPGS